ncbi:putative alpha-1,2-galactosyltransferase [Beauveria bassiana]|nr:putative alpha-1,2-galactosyltransferase [Beauveria bassiana]KAH8715375.1 putative alpha-1,2-galactosyltransferase [Beauveria bassiana]
MWNKQAFLQLLLLKEMAKPHQERLEWIFWADRDTVILDYCRSPASFVPEAIRSNNATSNTAQDRDINLLITNDHNGLMAGAFIIRVCEWSVNFLSDVISFRDFKPDVDLAFSEQSAMELILQKDRNKKHVAYVPQQWINNYRGDSAEHFINRQDVKGMSYWGARRGDFMVHFAGSDNKKGDILEYSGVGEKVFDRIQEGNVLRNVSMDIEQFWGNYTRDKLNV